MTTVKYGMVRYGVALDWPNINPAHDCQKSTIALHTYIGEKKAFFKAKNISRKSELVPLKTLELVSNVLSSVISHRFPSPPKVLLLCL